MAHASLLWGSVQRTMGLVGGVGGASDDVPSDDGAEEVDVLDDTVAKNDYGGHAQPPTLELLGVLQCAGDDALDCAAEHFGDGDDEQHDDGDGDDENTAGNDAASDLKNADGAAGDSGGLPTTVTPEPVSYTHLTLPTIYSV